MKNCSEQLRLYKARKRSHLLAVTALSEDRGRDGNDVVAVHVVLAASPEANIEECALRDNQRCT